MPVEYNLSHEETVSGWDFVMDQVLDNCEEYVLIIAPAVDKSEILMIDEKSSSKVLHRICINAIHDRIHDIIDEQEVVMIDNGFITQGLEDIIGLCIIAAQSQEYFSFGIARDWFKDKIDQNRVLMIGKNQNYGSSWSIMRPTSITDVIHTKIHRIISLLDGVERKYESILDSFEDSMNYCVFCILRMQLEGVAHEIALDFSCRSDYNSL